MRGFINVIAFASAVTVMAALAGCSVVDEGRTAIESVASEVARQVQLEGLGSQLRKMDGIDSVEGYYTNDADGVFAGAFVVAEQASDQQLAEAVEAIRAVFSMKLFKDVSLNVTVDVGEGSRLEQQHFPDSAESVADDLRYWRAAEQAIGARLTMWILPPWPDIDDYEYVREFNAVEPDHVQTTQRFLENINSLRGVDEPPSAAATVWSIPGLYSVPALPPEHVITLLQAVTAAAPLADVAAWQVAEVDEELEGTYVWWDGDLPDELTVEFLHPGEPRVVPPVGLALAESLAATGVSRYHLHLSESVDDPGSYVHFATCAVIPDAYGSDSDAYSFLVGASSELGPLGPGWCYKFPAD